MEPSSNPVSEARGVRCVVVRRPDFSGLVGWRAPYATFELTSLGSLLASLISCSRSPYPEPLNLLQRALDAGLEDW